MSDAVPRSYFDSLPRISFEYNLSDLKSPGDAAPFKDTYIFVGTDNKWYILGITDSEEELSREVLDLMQELYGPNL